MEINVCILKFFACSTLRDKHQYLFVALANPAGIDLFKVLLISVTDSKSPGEAIGNPASIISTPSSSKTREI